MQTTSPATKNEARRFAPRSQRHPYPLTRPVRPAQPKAAGRLGPWRRSGWTRPAGCLKLLAVWLVLGGLCSPAGSAGFTVYSQGTAAMGQGNAFVAEANDPSAIFYNPAGINQIQRPTIYGMVMLTYPERTYSSPTGNSDHTRNAFLPSGTFYMVYPVNQTISLGLGLFSPFGQQSQWPDSWEGRYISTSGSLSTYTINPVISFKPHEKFSIALGFDAMLSSVSLNRKVFLSPIMPDGDSSLQGHGAAFGFNLGLLLEAAEGVKLGVSYRYKMDMRYSGRLELPQLTFAGIQPADIPATADLTFPHLVTAGVCVTRLEPFTFNFDVTWTGWSSFGAIDIRLSQPILFNGIPTKSLYIPRHWHDSWTFRFGTAYRVNERIKLRLGYTYDLSAIPDSTFDPQVVNTNQHIFTLGGDIKFSQFTLGLAYNFLLGEQRTKNNVITTNGAPATLQANGKYQPKAHALALSLAYQF